MKIDTSFETGCAYELKSLPEPVLAPIWGEEETGRRVKNLGEGYLWSGDGPPPPLGARVDIAMNNLGPGTIVGYFYEAGWLGVHVRLENPPEWHRKQTKGTKREGTTMVFGAELARKDGR